MPALGELGFFAAVAKAEGELKLLAERTKAALAVAKARGKKLGCPLGAAAFGDRRGYGATEALKAKADRFARSLASIVQPLLDAGLSLRKIADKLNGQGIVTAQGKLWQANSVKRLVERLQAMA